MVEGDGWVWWDETNHGPIDFDELRSILKEGDTMINTNIRIIREFLGMSQSEWARWLGVSNEHVSRVERDERAVTNDYIKRIQRKLPVSHARLYQGPPPDVCQEIVETIK